MHNRLGDAVKVASSPATPARELDRKSGAPVGVGIQGCVKLLF